MGGGGAGCAHGSPSLPSHHTAGHAIGRRAAATAPGVSPTEQEEKKKKEKKKVWSVHTGEHRVPGDAHVTGLDSQSVGVCTRACVYVCVCVRVVGGGSVSVFGQMCDPQQLCPPHPAPLPDGLLSHQHHLHHRQRERRLRPPAPCPPSLLVRPPLRPVTLSIRLVLT